MAGDLSTSTKWWLKRHVLRPWVTCSQPGAGKRVALTFDDGPHPRFTRQVLEVLEAHDARATFFCVGRKLIEHSAMATEMLARGHELSNHSMTHPEFSGLSYEDIVREFDSVFSLVGDTGTALVTRQLIRPPYGTLNRGVLRYCLARNVHVAYWNRDPRDFAATSAEEVLAEFHARPLSGGDIVLLHDNTAHCADVVGGVLALIDAAGLEAVTISTLLAAGKTPASLPEAG